MIPALKNSIYEMCIYFNIQYYIKFGDQRFVDLGLGTQRVKCRVHKHFRYGPIALFWSK